MQLLTFYHFSFLLFSDYSSKKLIVLIFQQAFPIFMANVHIENNDKLINDYKTFSGPRDLKPSMVDVRLYILTPFFSAFKL